MAHAAEIHIPLLTSPSFYGKSVLGNSEALKILSFRDTTFFFYLKYFFSLLYIHAYFYQEIF